jgi:hypothetical protein
MIYTAHQPDLFPYSGFWYKMARADIFDVKIFDQMQGKPGYQRRVKMRDQWVGVNAKANSSYEPICDWRIDPNTEPEKLVAGITRAYKDAPNWPKYGPEICDHILRTRTPLLWHFNLEMIILIRDLLGITTPLGIGVRHFERGSLGIIETIQAYATTDVTYISGAGGKAYMGDCQEFTDAGIAVEYSRHKAITGDSILTVLMDYDEPMTVVMAEHEGDVT